MLMQYGETQVSVSHLPTPLHTNSPHLSPSRSFLDTTPRTWLCSSTTTKCLSPMVLNSRYARSTEKLSGTCSSYH